MDTNGTNSTRNLRRVLAVAASAASIMAAVPSFGAPLPISLIGANCTGSVDTSTGAITLTCAPSVPQTPSCTLSALPTSVQATGGPVTLTSNCGTVSAWTKNSAPTTQTSASWTDSIPATTLTTTTTFTYTVTGTGGTATAQVVQYGVTTPPPPNTTISCVGYSATHVIPVTLGSSTTRYYTNKNGGFANGDIDVYVITVPSNIPANTFFRIAGAEYGDQPTKRTASVSQTPCDFSTTMGAGAFFDSSPTVTMYAQVVTPGKTGSGYYPALQQGGTYYVNVKNWSYGAWQCTSTSCNMYMDFLKN